MSLEARVTALEEHQELCDRVLMRIDAKLELVLKEQKRQSQRLDAMDRRLDAMEKEFSAIKMQFEINQDLLMQIVNNLASQ